MVDEEVSRCKAQIKEQRAHENVLIKTFPCAFLLVSYSRHLFVFFGESLFLFLFLYYAYFSI